MKINALKLAFFIFFIFLAAKTVDATFTGYVTGLVGGFPDAGVMNTGFNSCIDMNTPGETYDLTENFYGDLRIPCLNISADNITLDCHGYAILGKKGSISGGWYIGINIEANKNITVKNCIISNFSIGINATMTNDSSFVNNTIVNPINDTNKGGIRLYNATNINITDSTFYNNTWGPSSTIRRGVYLIGSTGVLIKNNTFLKNDGIEIDGGSMNNITNDSFYKSSWIHLDSGNYVNITDNNLTNTSIGSYYNNYSRIENNRIYNSSVLGGLGQTSIDLSGGMYNVVKDNKIYGPNNDILRATDESHDTIEYNNVTGYAGLEAEDSTDVTFSHNNINCSSVGIRVGGDYFSEGIKINNNEIFNAADVGGIFLLSAENTNISDNDLHSNNYGVYFQEETITNNTVISNNKIHDNTVNGILLTGDTYTLISNNNFSNNNLAEINLTGGSYITISTNNITNTTYSGIFADYGASNVNITNNSMFNITYDGIYSVNSTNLTVQNNYFNNMQYAAEISGDTSDMNIKNNSIYNVTGAGLYAHNMYTDGDNITIYNNTFEGCWLGVRSSESADSFNVSSNLIYDGYQGISLSENPDNSTVSHNIINNLTSEAIRISNFYNATIYNNSINSTAGIHIESGDTSNVTGNAIYNTSDSDGIYAYDTNNSVIRGNVVNCSYAGVEISNSNYGEITNNTIFNNTKGGIGRYTITIYNSDHLNLTDNILNYSGSLSINAHDSGNLTFDNNTIENSEEEAFYIGSVSDSYFVNNRVFNSTTWDFYSYGDSINNTITNLTTNDTTSSFTYGGDIYLKDSDGTGRLNPTNHSNITHYLNITNETEAWVLLNISYSDFDWNPTPITNESTLRIWKHSSGEWTKNIGDGLELEGTSLGSDPGLVSYWRFEGDANDELGLNDGTAIGATVTTGRFGQGYYFDSDDDKIDMGNDSSIKLTSAFTYTFWFDSSDTAYDARYILDNSGEGEPGTSGGPIVYTNYNLFKSGYYNSTGGWGGGSATGISDNTWYFGAITWDGTTFRAYLNGVEVSNDSTHGPMGTSIADFIIGNRNDDTQDHYGLVDDVAVFNRTLSADEIYDLYSINSVDTANNYVYANISNFSSVFAPLGEEGTINISAPANLTKPNTQYNLTENITGNQSSGIAINISADNVTLDCQGYNITGNESGETYGIYVNGYNYITIKNCTVSNYNRGMYLNSSSYDTLINNTAYNNGMGIQFLDSNYDSVTDNIVNNNGDAGISAEMGSNHSNITNNTVNGNGDDGIAIYGSNNTVNNNTANNNGDGLYIYSGNNNILINNTANDNSATGIKIESESSSADDNSAINNIISGSLRGIYIECSSGCSSGGGNNNIFTNNNVMNSTAWDFYSENASNSTIINLTTNDTTSSFTYLGSIGLKDSQTKPSNPSGYSNISHYLNITNETAAWMLLNISYRDSDWNTTPIMNESTLRIWKYNGTAWTQNGITTYPTDTSNNIVSANISSFSVFAPLGASGAPPVADLEIYFFKISPTNVTPDQDFDMYTFINNTGTVTMTNITLWFYLNGKYWLDTNYLIPDLAPGENYEFLNTKKLSTEGIYNITIYVNSSVAEPDYTNNYNSTIVMVTEEPGRAAGPGIVILPVTPPVAPGITLQTIDTFPSFEITVSNCSLTNAQFNIPEGGATVLLKGSLDSENHPTPGTAAVLLYPSNISKNESKLSYIDKIKCIEPEEYAIAHCNQTVIASYEVNVTSDLSYLCINYQDTGVKPESVTINMNESGIWTPITIADVMNDANKSIICGNITGHTPYMISGFVLKPEIISAEDAISLLEKAISDNCPAHVACTQAQSLLEQARQSYDLCNYSEAKDLAERGLGMLTSKEQFLRIFLVFLVIAVIAGTLYFRKKKK